ncbi:MAG: nuclear transport factor 2 family protein [Gammaproteobacteria bacterium]|nr:nuclear transport factor 2 family protein [Gammaproteobacteria bacterium]
MTSESWLMELFKCIDTRNADGFARYLSENVEFRFGNSPAVTGREAVMQAVDGFFLSIGGLHHELIQTWCQGDSVICHGIVTYTRKAGSTLSVPFANIFTLTGKLVSRYLIFVDISALYSAGGA